tara:strand:+ start:66447 stop:67070 length:624 start_codon:yes stop_codon:yes gene_type:complete
MFSPKNVSKPLLSLLLVAAALITTACSSGPSKPVIDYKSDYDFSGIQKIAFYDESGDVTGDNPLQLSDFQKERIDDALAFALQNRGYQIVDSAADADLLVSWHLVTQNKTDVRSYPTTSVGMGVGYGPYGGYNRYSMYNCWGCMGGGSDVSVSNYTQGTFIVDLIDPSLRKSVWRGTTESRMKGEHAADQDKYNAAATRIFASFPPS